ncbi:MAG: hypothetical protein R3266_04015 [Gemmatimonadota bacterium]|nr:hypothetical protein [Gemmatimonadota bacterium]
MDGSHRAHDAEPNGETAAARTASASRGLCWRWTAASAAGLAVGLPLALLLLDPLGPIVGMMLVTPIVFCIAGAVLGGSQWVALRRLARAPLWIALTAIGLGIGITAGVVTVEQVGRLISGTQVRAATASPLGLAAAFLALGSLGGLALGVAQWFYLRRIFDGAWRWIGWTAGAMGLGMLAGAVVAEIALGGFTSFAGAIVAFAVAALTVGVVTGRRLERFVRDAAAAFRLAEAG